MAKTARLSFDGKDYDFPTVVGTEEEVGIDITSLRTSSGAITLDPGFGNTGSCKSAITFIDGEKGILRYRGYPIEQLAENASFSEVSYLLIYGELPNRQQLTEWRRRLTYHSMIHEDMKKFYEGYPANAHPMAILSSMIASMSTYYPNGGSDADDLNIIRVLAKAKRSGFTRHIGVSNFTVAMLDEAVRVCPEPLVTNQIEYHAYLPQDRMIAALKKYGMILTAYCPVVEFGLVGQTMHQVDERVPLADLRALTLIYRKIIDRYFA